MLKLVILLALGLAVLAGAVWFVVWFVTGLSKMTLEEHEAKIRTKIVARGDSILRVRRTDQMARAPGIFGRLGAPTTFYNVLVDQGGIHRTEVWRVDDDGAFQN